MRQLIRFQEFCERVYMKYITEKISAKSVLVVHRIKFIQRERQLFPESYPNSAFPECDNRSLRAELHR